MPTIQIKNSSQPNITYLPDRKNWKERTERRLAEEQLTRELPEGFPEQLEGPKLWTGSDYEGKEEQWVYNLTEEELLEIDNAVKDFEATGKPLSAIQKDTFPLPNLGPKLKKLVEDEVVDGRGFLVVRGINPDQYSREQQVIAYAGTSAHIGKRGLQGRHVLGNGSHHVSAAHIKDLVPKKGLDDIIAPAYTNDHQVYHTDIGDIISLFAVGVAAEGGKSRIASSWTVYNELARERPDLIETLASNWAFQDDFAKEGEPGYYQRPLLYYVENNLIIQYARRSFTGFGKNPRRDDIPPITEAQAEALDALHYIAEKYNLGVDFQKGDIQYINNLSIFHARDGFTDSEEKQRHLLRLWLHPENAWKLPKQLEPVWNKIYHKERDEVFPLEPTTLSGL
ncbi:Clavaminate synthase-like protein [Basidiobolus meristosporus CBS 931.73]|uniref:Clavaminate synthase-like protein n=1 Tax=Basidiobolus meristosporus CBS 931.73 TaxID=1314790 RepID=A0A1Y1XWK3_9FUNG|nr:Clavaminate synthase-like protein [Basidiobolus meristosporus CBS 931.73]|eukprot:ORX90130.1 Clavaminate synthase-like protein [Basidiobolus meristosporus CBS 931.73]